ncbi:hypothetical protein FGG08_002807 [Glutinoglossum americanum]|uniref:Protein HRI1 n=1 Tax=Glutinoglossum americanum TaxID=1670608 RepID=A0A9P8IC98_9PEZI|nr:hypothetical protein FGG08_002807 [Glutinoglossum americanum]
MSLPAASKRRSIRWLPNEAIEPTSTLVLTSRNQHFVDLRIFKPLVPGEPDLPNEGGPLRRLDWAFSGIATVTEDRPGCLHSEWSHEVDSRSDNPDKDEGDLIPQRDGSILEIGRMVNPSTGEMTDYEEVWEDLEVEVTGGDTHRICIVVGTVDDVRGIRGKIVRVGQWCQGILKVGAVTSVERWHWAPRSSDTSTASKGEQSNGSGGDWERVVKTGGAYIPCSLTFMSGTHLNGVPATEENDELKAGDTTWKVVEKYVW